MATTKGVQLRKAAGPTPYVLTDVLGHQNADLRARPSAARRATLSVTTDPAARAATAPAVTSWDELFADADLISAIGAQYVRSAIGEKTAIDMRFFLRLACVNRACSRAPWPVELLENVHNKCVLTRMKRPAPPAPPPMPARMDCLADTASVQPAPGGSSSRRERTAFRWDARLAVVRSACERLSAQLGVAATATEADASALEHARAHVTKQALLLSVAVTQRLQRPPSPAGRPNGPGHGSLEALLLLGAAAGSHGAHERARRALQAVVQAERCTPVVGSAMCALGALSTHTPASAVAFVSRAVRHFFAKPPHTLKPHRRALRGWAARAIIACVTLASSISERQDRFGRKERWARATRFLDAVNPILRHLVLDSAAADPERALGCHAVLCALAPLARTDAMRAPWELSAQRAEDRKLLAGVRALALHEHRGAIEDLATQTVGREPLHEPTLDVMRLVLEAHFLEQYGELRGAEWTDEAGHAAGLYPPPQVAAPPWAAAGGGGAVEHEDDEDTDLDEDEQCPSCGGLLIVSGSTAEGVWCGSCGEDVSSMYGPYDGGSFDGNSDSE